MFVAITHQTAQPTLALTGLAAVLLLMTGVWLASLRKRDASIIDPF